MSTQIGKWLLAGVMAVSGVMANQRAQAYGDGTAEAMVTGLAIGAVAATLIRDDGHHHHRESYREVHHYYDEPHYRHCPPRVHVEHHHHGHHGYGHHGRRDDYYDDGYRGHGGYYDRGRSVIVNHF